MDNKKNKNFLSLYKLQDIFFLVIILILALLIIIKINELFKYNKEKYKEGHEVNDQEDNYEYPEGISEEEKKKTILFNDYLNYINNLDNK